MDNPWDQRFSGDEYFYGKEANAFLRSQAARLRPGMRALAVGDGEGRNGVWLAEQGLDVLSVDGSPVGLAKARRLAAERGVALRTEQVDLFTWDPGEAMFDAIVSIFIHLPPAQRAAVHGRLARALRPGGVLILEAYTPQQLAFRTGGPQDAALLMTAEQLRSDFAGLETVSLIERIGEIHEGTGHQGPSALVDLIAQKPLKGTAHA